MSGPALLALSPWVVFILADHRNGMGFGVSSALALASAAALALASWRRGTLRRFEVQAVALFFVFVMVGIAAPAGSLVQLDRFGRAIATGSLALVALGSLLARPFTLEFTNSLVPRHRLASAAFLRANRRQSLAWGLAATAVTASLVPGAILVSPLAGTVCNWLVPFAVVATCASYTSWCWASEVDEEYVAAPYLPGRPSVSDAEQREAAILPFPTRSTG